ncbi:hypothetical protein KEM60_03092 [Austwickia sp. TVS 96-490-7B]|nr:hypothetical protein [Austwickia sp. TVS 96-490-7B]
MTDGDIPADAQMEPRVGVQDAAILHVGSGANGDGVQVTASDDAVPNACAFLDDHCTDQRGRTSDERRLMDRRHTVEHGQQHDGDLNREMA